MRHDEFSGGRPRKPHNRNRARRKGGEVVIPHADREAMSRHRSSRAGDLFREKASTAVTPREKAAPPPPKRGFRDFVGKLFGRDPAEARRPFRRAAK